MEKPAELAGWAAEDEDAAAKDDDAADADDGKKEEALVNPCSDKDN